MGIRAEMFTPRGSLSFSLHTDQHSLCICVERVGMEQAVVLGRLPSESVHHCLLTQVCFCLVLSSSVQQLEETARKSTVQRQMKKRVEPYKDWLRKWVSLAWRRLRADLIHGYKAVKGKCWEDGKMEPGSAQWCPVIGQMAIGASWSRGPSM